MRTRKPHLRTPGYIFGLIGVIERECVGMADNPEGLAFRQVCPLCPYLHSRMHWQSAMVTIPHHQVQNVVSQLDAGLVTLLQVVQRILQLILVLYQ